MECLQEYLEQYLKKRKEACRRLLFDSEGMIMIIGNAEAGKSYLLTELYNMSTADIKCFHGGVRPEQRIEMLSNIVYYIQNEKNEDVKELYLDEFDDEASLHFINKKFVQKGVKVINTTKNFNNFFQVNKENSFYLSTKEFNKELISKFECEMNLKKKLSEFQIGDWFFYVI